MRGVLVYFQSLRSSFYTILTFNYWIGHCCKSHFNFFSCMNAINIWNDKNQEIIYFLDFWKNLNFSEKSQRFLKKLPPLRFSSKLLGDSFLALPMDMKISKNYNLIQEVKILGSLIFLEIYFIFSETVLGTVICPLANSSSTQIMPGMK